jgi:hypothetical protein
MRNVNGLEPFRGEIQNCNKGNRIDCSGKCMKSSDNDTFGLRNTMRKGLDMFSSSQTTTTRNVNLTMKLSAENQYFFASFSFCQQLHGTMELHK